MGHLVRFSAFRVTFAMDIQNTSERKPGKMCLILLYNQFGVQAILLHMKRYKLKCPLYTFVIKEIIFPIAFYKVLHKLPCQLRDI